MATPVEGGSPRGGIEHRLVGIWLCVLVLAGAVALAAQTRSREAASAPRGPWVDLPPGGMDVSTWASRQWLRDGHVGGIGDGLAARCGHDPALPRERYTALLPRGDGSAWRAVIDIGNDFAWVTATHDPALRLAPGAPMQRAGGKDTMIVRPRRFAREQLDGLRRDWRVPALWAAPVSDTDAAGRLPPVVLEACVDGLYAARLRQDSPAARQLANTLSQLMETPPGGG